MAGFNQWFNPLYTNGLDEEYRKVTQKVEEDKKLSPRQAPITPEAFVSTSGTKTDGGNARTAEWERGMLHDLPYSYGRSYDAKFESLMDEMGVSLAERKGFRKYLDAEEKGVGKIANQNWIMDDLKTRGSFSYGKKKEDKEGTPKKEAPFIKDDDRGLLDRLFDGLLVGNYASAGFADGLVKQIQNKTDDPWIAWKQAWEGVKAGNVLGEGNTKGEYTYSKVLEGSGWKPESLGGKVAKGTTGFALDVLLDPTTYLTLGGSAVIKGTGRAGQKTAQSKVIKNLAKEFGVQKSNPDKMTWDIFDKAKEKLIASGKTTEESTELARKIADNARLAMDTAGGGLDINSAKKLITESQKKRGNTISGKQLDDDAEKLVAQYNKAQGIYKGGRDATLSVSNLPFGETERFKKMFGNWTQNKLTFASNDTMRKIGDYTLAPAYKRLRNSIYGSKMGKLFSTKSGLYELSKKDPTALYDVLKFTEFTRGTKSDMLNQQKAIADFTKTMNLTPAQNKELLEALQDPSVWKNVTKTVRLAETQEAKRYKKMLASTLRQTGAEVEEVLNNKSSLEALRNANEAELSDAKGALKVLEDEHVENLTNLNLNHLTNHNQLKKLNEEYAEQIKKLEDDMEFTHASAQKGDTADYSEFDNLIKEWDEQYKGNKAFQTARDNGEDVSAMSKPDMSKKFELVDKVNKAIYPNGNGINYDTSTKELKKLIDFVKSGESKQSIRNYVESKPVYFNGQMKEIQNTIGEIMGYGQGKKFESIDDLYHKPLSEFTDKVKRGVELTAREEQELARLQQIGLQYRMLTGKFYNMNPNDFKKFRRELANDKLAKEVESILPIQNATKLVDDSSLENARRSEFFNQDASSARNEMPVDKVPYSAKLTPEDSDDLMSSVMNVMALRMNGRAPVNYSPSQGEQKYIENVMLEAQNLLSNHFGRKYSDMTLPQKNLLVKMATGNVSKGATGKGIDPSLAQKAMKEAQKRAELERQDLLMNKVRLESEVIFKAGDGQLWKGKVTGQNVGEDGVRTLEVLDNEGKTVNVNPGDLHTVRNNGVKVTDEELIQSSDMTQEYLSRIEELKELRKSTAQQYSDAKKSFSDESAKLESTFTKQYEDTLSHIKNLEKTGIQMRDTLESMTHTRSGKDISEVTSKMEEISKVLNDDDAYETYLRANFDEGRLDDWVQKSINPDDVGKIVLDQRPYDDKVKQLTKVLRANLNDIAEKEISRGKLKREQYDGMLGAYLPHILTPDGARLFKRFTVQTDGAGNITKIPRELQKKGVSVTQDLGYGQKWNPHSASRTIKKIQMPDGRWVENPSIEQINESLAPILKGRNAFSESIADIYTARALQHTETIYDDTYMRTMMHTFGKDIDPAKGVEEGYKAVSNIGMLKERINGHVYDLLKGWEKQGTDITRPNVIQRAEDQVLKAFDMPKKALDGEAMPMVELSESQVQKISAMHPDLVKQVNNVIANKANQARKIQIAKDKNRFLQIYDKFTHFIKLNQTTIMPAFHLRNKYSNMFNNWLAVGVDSANPKFQATVAKVAYHKGDAEKLKNAKLPAGFERIVTPNGKVYEWDELYHIAKSHDVIDEGFFAKDIGAETGSAGIIKPLPSKLDPTSTENFVPYQVGGRIGNQIENQDRLLNFASNLKQGKSIEEAIDSTNKYLFDYSDLTHFEQNVMKRIMPYYTWIRKNGRLQATEWMENSGKYRATAKALNGVDGMVNEEDKVDRRFVSRFAKDWAQTPFSYNTENKFGKKVTEPILLNPNMPFMDLTRMPDPANPVDSAINLFTQSNPILKVPIEQALNKNFFFDNTITKEDDSAVTKGLKRADHVARQNAGYTALVDTVKKEGIDKGLHIGNALSGVKMLSYDYDTAKSIKIAEALGKYKQEQSPIDPVIDKAQKVEAQLKNMDDFVVGGKEGTVLRDGADAMTHMADLWLSGQISGKDHKEFKPVFDMLEKVGVDEAQAREFTWSVLDATDLDGMLGKDFEVADVKEVIDGDTFRVDVNGKEQKVRLMLVDTPETRDPDINVPMPFGKEASEFTKEQIEGENIKLVIDTRQKDKNGRVLAYVYHNGDDFNKRILSEGLGKVRYTDFGRNMKQEEYFDTQRKTAEQGRGIWGVEGGYAGSSSVDGGYDLDVAKRLYLEMLQNQ